MKVLQVIPSVAPRYGGPPRVVRDLCSSLASRGHQVGLVTTDLDGPARIHPSDLSGEFPPEVEVHVAKTVWPRGYATAPSLRRTLSRIVPQVDLVHVHGVYQHPTWVACRVARRFGVPYVCHVHGALTAYHRRQKALKKRPYEFLVERRNLSEARAVIVMTELEEADFQAWLPGSRTVLVPPSLDAALFRPDAPIGHLPTSWRVAEGRRVVSFLGRFAEKKGLDLLVDSFALLHKELPDVYLILAGPDDDGLGDELRARVRAHGLEGHASIVGLVSGGEKTALLSGSEVFALPSKDESFGVAVAEALALGTPVVVSRQVGLSDAVEGAGAGLVASRDPAALAEAIGRIVRDRDLRSAMAARGRRMAQESFAPEAVVSRVEAIYRAACDG